MTLLLDSHAFLWLDQGGAQFSAPARAAIRSKSNSFILSSASIWELAIKSSQGKLSLAIPITDLASSYVRRGLIQILLPSLSHYDRLMTLPYYHRDPFDRLIVAQSLAEGVPLVSSDRSLDAYGVQRIW